jgi:hypothetical protein
MLLLAEEEARGCPPELSRSRLVRGREGSPDATLVMAKDEPLDENEVL